MLFIKLHEYGWPEGSPHAEVLVNTNHIVSVQKEGDSYTNVILAERPRLAATESPREIELLVYYAKCNDEEAMRIARGNM